VVNISGGKAAVPTLAPWMVADILKQEPVITAWLKAVKDRALTQMLNGEQIPGYKVVEGRGSRDWRDVKAVESALLRAGFEPEQYMAEPKLLSPAQMEKSLGKKRAQELVGEFINTEPGNPVIAPATDKREPYNRLDVARRDFLEE
jgi:hypothetical protein